MPLPLSSFAVLLVTRNGLKVSRITWPFVPPMPKPLMLKRLVWATGTFQRLWPGLVCGSGCLVGSSRAPEPEYH
ncbi:hypothetical protein CC78DRAFT_532446 [Lojkania enalia]|uniref:Uncharacterized protein n=1 Tax=Lojkania enalia TaxID=147567 RepID=A0A9P4N4X7_9PLEO|nr:hypothetical protein CC78DRAFT_532446 [Didymosphaeria enalia]